MLQPGAAFPDFELTDHAGNRRRLSDLVAGDPTVLQFYRGWWCPKEQAYFRRLVAFQDEVEVAYARIISVSVDPPTVAAAFRATLRPDLTIHHGFDGYWFWGRPTIEELRSDMREITRTIRGDWAAPTVAPGGSR